ncbi:MAG: nucleoside/nucleotide kinase family protein [Oceanospirillaceae bacterium]|nr:nucleoside/nucleotide kinase family protein [Oceanospirillaceae bacterium]
MNISAIAERIVAIHPTGYRTLVALAGAPASGKSTLAQALVEALNAAGHGAVLVPMDGFHLDNRLLETRGLLERKGAPETFDAAGFIHLIGRLSQEAEIAIPLFDRDRDIAIAGAAMVGPAQRIAIVEGNYLLFDEAPWSRLSDFWDLSIRLDTAEDELERRLVQRWLEQGLDAQAASERARRNDLANAVRIRERRLPADLLIET